MIRLRVVWMGLMLLATAGWARAQATGAEQWMAVIDVERVLRNSEAGKQELERINGMRDERVKELETLQNEVRKLQDQLKNHGFSISEQERRRLQREIEDKVILGQRKERDYEREINVEFESVLGEMEKRVLPVIEQIGQERAVQVIFNRATPGLVYFDPAMDITAEVIKRLDTSGQ